ncbi:hypothetical protein ACFQY0_06275 [Haloferula chungangensis]|uniref:SLA1 homology domain-containing protein n=1 Tax=Haloferula chungangensis TaxID=1048331 RepID=A0ABW2L599_9BACT
MPARLLFISLFLTGILHAESRNWKSAAGESTFSGEFISHDTQRVTIRREDGRVFTFDVAKLSEEDRNWLATKDSIVVDDAEPAPDPNAVFDTLCFGDSRKEVEAKLKASKNVETLVDETFFGRFGLNGTFRTKQKIGGLYCELFFDWSKGGNLKEISLQTQPKDAGTYDDLLRNNWNQLSELLTMLHGKPLQTAGYPEMGDLQNDLFLGSHIWRLEGGGTAMLGTSMQANKYMVVVRFTTERINPVVVP